MKLVKQQVYNNELQIPKPIIKWVGGKSSFVDKLISDFPVIINNYHEIFLGGGSVLFTLLTFVKEGIIQINGNIYANDLNDTLINMYKNIQSNHNELYNKIQEYIKEINECNGDIINRKPTTLQQAKQSKENYYYWMRIQYNKLTVDEKKTTIGSAMFIFLNKTCFRGVFRVGPNGFNVPYGHYTNPEIINKEHLDEIHNLIQNVIFKTCDFTESLKNINDDDYLYLDPPYAPEKDTSFVGYTEKGFNNEEHKKLFDICNK